MSSTRELFLGIGFFNLVYLCFYLSAVLLLYWKLGCIQDRFSTSIIGIYIIGFGGKSSE